MGTRNVSGVRKVVRGGKPRWFIDFPFTDLDGVRQRFRRDASVQNYSAALAEGSAAHAPCGRNGIRRADPCRGRRPPSGHRPARKVAPPGPTGRPGLGNWEATDPPSFAFSLLFPANPSDLSGREDLKAPLLKERSITRDPKRNKGM